ncbi:short-chain fatty acyl-CoA regulator family protein [Nitrospirillum amazonense]|uniref:short-chain fatty acyl-CoA regulator family protein n=1 Tax=Nitrospirillum amazonense TaxID=28077 RepID=UPI002DD42ED1|nr:short-chain fatty acyl-CoA regulator family protein [Nitrospirillum amazonense]MEC4589673.1 short-chain fatty acyl-CoA regulator family protein [Nitrospirillum amazonense]
MRKQFVGVRLRRLREEKGLTQAALARALELSPSYLNQLEQNLRPLTVPVLLKINAVFGVDVQLFSEDEEARLVASMRDALTEAGVGEGIALAELKELAATMPAVGRALLTLQGRYRDMVGRLEQVSTLLGEDWRGTPKPLMPFEEVRDFFAAHHNHIDVLDTKAEALYHAANLAIGAMTPGLQAHLARRHDVRVAVEGGGAGERTSRRYDAASRILHLSPDLTAGQRAFHMATQLAFLEHGEALNRLTAQANFSGEEARGLARIGLANYFAGAVLLPYQPFLSAAEAVRYDIERLERQFGVGFETICHRLSTLQRPDARGVPFFFVRVDRAGNISKRQSATDFHFSRVGGSCPLWNVYEAFAQPGRILTQRAVMPEGRQYLWVARTVTHGAGGYGAPAKQFAIGLGCDIRHADRLVYAKGIDLSDPDAATPIGAGCKVCERADCAQRAFPAIDKPLVVDEAVASITPYQGRG